MTQTLLRFFWGSAALFLVMPLRFVLGAKDFTITEDPAKLENPLSITGGLTELINAILSAVVQIGVPIAALFIVYSGFLFVLARGNETALKKAQVTLTYTIIGTAVLLGALAISTVIQGTLEQVLQ